MRDFLSYVVEETLNGRSAYLKALPIAQAVFGADDKFDPEANSIVRVEAGRLRRRLTQYYSTIGLHDPIIIAVPKGTYAPEFSQNFIPDAKEIPAQANQWAKSLFSSRRALLGAVAVIALLTLIWSRPDILKPVDDLSNNRTATALQGQDSEAEILFRQAFVLLMPPENRARLNTSIELFQNVIDSEPGFAGGYAGKSLVYSISVLFFKSQDPAGDLFKAATIAERAIELEPENSLGYAALTLAQSLDSKHTLALESARRSIASAKREPIADVMVSLALLNSSSPYEAIDLLSESLNLVTNQPRTPHLNVLGIAYYVTGNYQEASRNFELNLARKGPAGPHMDVFRAATYARLDNDFQARAILEKLQRTHADYPIELWLGNFITSDDDLLATMRLLRTSGLLAK